MKRHPSRRSPHARRCVSPGRESARWCRTRDATRTKSSPAQHGQNGTGVVLGRKNHFGSRSERGTQVAAMMYSLVESAKLNRVDPELYLKLAALESIGGRSIPLPHQLG